MAKSKKRDENGFCIIHQKEYAIPKCKICEKIYYKEYYAKKLKNGKREKKNEESTSYYRKIKKMGYNTNYILVKAMHGNVTGHGEPKEYPLPHNIKIGS